MGGFENVEHLAILLGVVATSTGLLKGLRGWRKARDEATRARDHHEQMLAEMLREFRPNGGGSMADRTARIETAIGKHVADADAWFRSNDDAHKDIHRRIDGVFELLAGNGATQPRKTAERHRAIRPPEEGK